MNQAHTATTDFCLRLARATAVLVRRFDTSLGSLHGISFSDYQLLNHLARAPGGRLRRVDLAERVGLSASGVTRSLLPLEKIGLVTRQADPRDARVGFAVITPAGADMAIHATDVVDRISREAIRGIDPGQVGNMASMLGDIAGMNSSNT